MPVLGVLSQSLETTPDFLERVPLALGGRALSEFPDLRSACGALAAEIAATLPYPEPSAPASISPSTRAALERLGDDPVPAASFVAALLQIHPEYGADMGRRMAVAPERGAREQPGLDWVEEVRRLYRPDRVPELHGRHVIRGLALLEPDLTRDLLEHGFLGVLEDELDPPLPQILSREGRRLWQAEPVPAHADRPATIDALGRRGFANALADMIEEERGLHRDAPESFLVHLHGPWGSGKTSVLGFIADALGKAQPPWVVVQFNAWQHERLGAPWWSLMSAVHRQGNASAKGGGAPVLRALRPRVLRLRALRAWWLLRPALPALLLVPLVVGLLWVGIEQGWFRGAGDGKGGLAQAERVAKAVGAVFAVVATLLAAARGLRRSTAAGSARGAEAFIRHAPDPMGLLVRRFKRVVDTIERPVIVLIDDMDRCQPQYLVDVLHGIQTLLIEAPVTYVVAADRRWLYDSYAKIYDDFKSLAQDPGRPMGHLFLEKTFQLSASLPAIPPHVRDAYWSSLLHGVRSGDPPLHLRLTHPQMDHADLQDILDTTATMRELPPNERQAALEAATERIGAAEVRQEIEHRLLPFAPLLEPNPRAMKRLVNAYRIELTRLLAEGRAAGSGAVPPEQLALWTIVALRWPLLADELARRPALVENAELDTPLRELLASDEVQAVLRGRGVRAKLTEQAVRAIAGHTTQRGDDLPGVA